jgi:thioredoxin-like negative regulator of GroEL
MRVWLMLQLAKAVLFSSKADTPPLWKALSIEYNLRLALGEVKKSQKDIAEALGVTTLPAVVVFDAEGEKVVYDGVLKNAPLTEFFDKYAVAKKKGSGKKSEDDAPPAPPKKECTCLAVLIPS